MNVDMDTDDWLGCPTPLEMYQHQCAILVDELVETERMLRRARANIAGLVQMNDLLMKGKAETEAKLAEALEKIGKLEKRYSLYLPCFPISMQMSISLRLISWSFPTEEQSGILSMKSRSARSIKTLSQSL